LFLPSGILTEGSPVYVNYGRKQDFEQLNKELSVSVVERIVIARYGLISAKEKAKNAALYGARGLILYADPELVAQTGEANHNVYPNRYVSIVTIAWSANFKMVWYVLLRPLRPELDGQENPILVLYRQNQNQHCTEIPVTRSVLFLICTVLRGNNQRPLVPKKFL
jgi:hypothetical protein